MGWVALKNGRHLAFGGDLEVVIGSKSTKKLALIISDRGNDARRLVIGHGAPVRVHTILGVVFGFNSIYVEGVGEEHEYETHQLVKVQKYSRLRPFSPRVTN
jgi:hypothetical protein